MKVADLNGIPCSAETDVNLEPFRAYWAEVVQLLPAAVAEALAELRQVVFTAAPIETTQLGRPLAASGIADPEANEIRIHSGACDDPTETKRLIAHEIRHVWQFATGFAANPTVEEIEAYYAALQTRAAERDANEFARNLGYWLRPLLAEAALHDCPTDASFLAVARSWPDLKPEYREELKNRAVAAMAELLKGVELPESAAEPEEARPASAVGDRIMGIPFAHNNPENLTRFCQLFRRVAEDLPTEVAEVLPRLVLGVNDIVLAVDGRPCVAMTTSLGIQFSGKALADDETAGFIIARELRRFWQLTTGAYASKLPCDLSEIVERWQVARMEGDAEQFAYSLFPAAEGRSRNQAGFPTDDTFRTMAGSWPALNRDQLLELAAEATAKKVSAIHNKEFV